MGLNDLAMELSLNTQTENCDSMRFCFPNPTADKIRKWDLPSLINLNARSLNSEKVDELHVTVATHDVSIVCVSETWFKTIWIQVALLCKGFAWREKIGVMDEPVV